MAFIKPVLYLGLAGIAGFFGATDPTVLATLKGRTIGPELTQPADLANGKVAFYAGGCTSCHATEGQPDKTRLGGGHALKSPFGTFYAPNISPHPRDGIGAWTVQQFAKAMVEGVSPDGRHYYPAFPFTSYQKMSAADLRDMFAFIKTLPPVEGKIRDHDLPFPFNIRRSLGGWKLLFVDGKPFTPDPTKSASWNRGAYLVNGPGHCAECHSARNLLGVITESERFAGGADPEGKGWVPNITPHEKGIKSWSKGDLASVLEDGLKPDGDSLGGTMASVVRNMAQLTKADREAMAEYLLSLPPRPGTKPEKK